MTLDSINAWIAAQAKHNNRMYGITEDEAEAIIRYAVSYGIVVAGDLAENLGAGMDVLQPLDELAQEVEGP